MKIKKYGLKKFDYNVNVSNKKFYTPDETINQTLEVDVKFLKDRKDVKLKLNFKINMFDEEEINIFKLKIEYILVLDRIPPEIDNKIAEKIVTTFYPILNKLISSFYQSNGLKEINLPKF